MTLHSIQQNVTEPLLRNFPQEAEDINFIFSANKSIILYSEQFLEELSRKLKNWNFESTLGDLFIKFSSFWKVYIDYTNTLDIGFHRLQNLFEKNTELKHFIEEKQSFSELAKFLGLPVQKIPRYILFVEEFVALTPNSHADSDLLDDATEKLHLICWEISKRKRESENFAKLYSIQQILDPPITGLITPQRKLIKEGSIPKVIIVDAEKVVKECYLVVLNDMIMIAKAQVKKFKFSGGKLKYKVRSNFSMQEIKVSDIAENEIAGATNAFRLTNIQKKSWAICCKDENEKNIWIREISNAKEGKEDTAIFQPPKRRQRKVTAAQRASLPHPIDFDDIFLNPYDSPIVPKRKSISQGGLSREQLLTLELVATENQNNQSFWQKFKDSLSNCTPDLDTRNCCNF
eukprot:TRINITY_DN649_c2_g4_i1.p1 TRINITY_DN649_c2_g4~~TRINITY_DN649_c2_g4_i1.p1  ORF type:complete len:403 (-),score=153.72 TRINITY_DN649_c2_g4_i1:11-1219(-)